MAGTTSAFFQHVVSPTLFLCNISSRISLASIQIFAIIIELVLGLTQALLHVFGPQRRAEAEDDETGKKRERSAHSMGHTSALFIKVVVCGSLNMIVFVLVLSAGPKMLPEKTVA